tara:strand:+ start:809 stop:2035 length:1227 start_codon:yes stop_codon:yes gene_type:complete
MSSAALLRLMKAMGEKLPTTVSKAKPIVTKTKKVVDKPIATKTIDTPIVSKTIDTPIVTKTKTSKPASLSEAKIAAQERGVTRFRYEGKMHTTPVKDSKRKRQSLKHLINETPKERSLAKKYAIDKSLNSLPGGTKRWQVDPNNRERIIEIKSGKSVGIAEMKQMVKRDKDPKPPRRRLTLTPKGEKLFDNGNYKKILKNPNRYMYEGSNAPLTPKQQPPKTKEDRALARKEFKRLSKRDKVEFVRNAIDPELTASQISDVLGITSRSVKLPPKEISKKVPLSQPLSKKEIIKRLMDILERQVKNKSLTMSQKKEANDQLKKLSEKYNQSTSILNDLSSTDRLATTSKEIKDAGGFGIRSSGFKKGGKVTAKKKKIIKPKTIKTAKKKSALRGIGSAKRGYGKAMGRA